MSEVGDYFLLQRLLLWRGRIHQFLHSAQTPELNQRYHVSSLRADKYQLTLFILGVFLEKLHNKASLVLQSLSFS